MAMAFLSQLNLQEILQTLSVLQWMPVYVFLGAIPIILIPYFLVFTKFWMVSVLALAWLAYDWNTHSQGGRRSAWVRNWTIWKYFQNYFPVKLVKTHDLSPRHNYIIASHPHGVLPYGTFINFATETTGFARIFPGITPYVATLEGIFWIPIVREYVMSMGVCPVSELALKYLLTQKGSGNAVVIMVGGGAEALLCHPGATTVLLKQRKGFVKVALETGAYLVPSYSFGQNEVHNQETFPEGTWKRFFQKAFQDTLKKLLGLSFCIFHGRGLTRGSWGFLPFNHPITTVVGEPLPIPRIKKPNEETVDKYHTLYINALQKLFDEHKVHYGLSETQELTIV
ncbi:diacylglycerol O-acyltransferase 2-like protein 6 [Bubalus kerabau]|uniref:diacylglycerol O-acyltransferase 2-like protein 6 n=1 Tax=Bubalus carabanensis TaxID=3119969 RepID=UPI00042CD3D5|nr:diacylglycerol O-acyltransferase 2-like protein 6 isoform X2 [Bubalus bubalis]XP_055421691.1 diacylglycerol O-acyltransferase 2-like protein 6 [Bubalus carabanensis]